MKKFLAFIPAAVLFAFFIVPSCQKEISEENGYDSLFIAAGSLKDSNNICLKDSVHGTFYDGVTPGTDTAYIELEVNVTTPGSYTIATDNQNGFLFSASGYFTDTGLNIVQLKPAGTPILQKLTDFMISFDTSVCFVTVDVKDSTGTGLGGGIDTTGSGGGGGSDSTAADTWKFTASDSLNFSGSATSVFTTTGINYLAVAGISVTGDTAFQIDLNLPSATITPGTYTTGGLNIFSYLSFTNGDIYKADASTGSDVVTVIIKSYNSTTQVITGTFSGTARDASGKSVPITKGAFNAFVDQ